MPLATAERVIERGFALQNIHVLGQLTQGHIVVGLASHCKDRAFWVLVFVRMAQIHLHAVAGGQYGQLRRGLVRLCVVGVVQAVLQLRQARGSARTAQTRSARARPAERWCDLSR